MNDELTENERRILSVLQQGLPADRTPYRIMARRAGVAPQQLLKVLKSWKRQGRLRRIGAVVNHFKVGLPAAAMLCWRVEPQRLEKAAKLLVGFKQVSHAYERTPAGNFPYNLYAMVHGTDPDNVHRTIERIGRVCGLTGCRIMETEKELKKTPPRYDRNEDNRRRS